MMSDEQESYLRGPRLREAVPDCSFAEYFIPLMRSHPMDNIIQMDAATGRGETSAEVLSKSVQISEGYRRLGLQQDDVFCLLSRNSSEVFSAVLGVMWLGGVLAPLDPDWKRTELEFMFEEVLRPTVVICEECVLDKVVDVLAKTKRSSKIVVLARRQNVKKPHVAFEDLLSENVDVENYNPQPVPSPSSKTALIIPTSGSTGLPKGVAITHRNLIFQLISLKHTQLEYTFKSVLQLSHFYWVTSFIILLISAANGLKRIYLTEVNPSNILKAIREHKPEWTLISPPLFATLLQQRDFNKSDFSHFKLIIFAGTPVMQSVTDSVKGIWENNLPLSNYYGLSETTGIVTRSDVGVDALSGGNVAFEITVKIVDMATGKVLGPNERGEIMVRTPAMMKEYLGNEKATKEVLIDNWFHTGDFGYYDGNGKLHIVNRIKEIIKVFNRQVSPSEIEGVLETIPGVQEAAVVGMLNDTENCYLMGLIVRERESNVSEGDIKNFLKENLADYKQLKMVKFVGKIPRTPIGKLKRKELQDLAASLAA